MIHPTRLNCRVDHKPAAPAAAAGAEADPAELPRRVTAALAHNVNNALAAVIGHLELALREADPGAARPSRLRQALGCALRAAERVRRMIAFVRRPEASLSAALCLRGAADRAARRAAAENPGLRVELHGPESPCPVRANETLLHLVLEQLVSNAVEAMPDGGTLVLSAWDEGPRRCLSVGDTGHGLSAEVRRRLFEPFFTTKSHGHLGLGLALCRDVIEAGGGAVHVTSAEGQGTTVTLSFPPPDESPAAPRDPLPSSAESFAI
jgi:signal transduction histidine kinase